MQAWDLERLQGVWCTRAAVAFAWQAWGLEHLDGDKTRNPSQNPEPANDDGTGCQKSRETSPITLTNPNQEMIMEQDAKRVGRQAPQPQPERGNDDGTGYQKTLGTSPGSLAGTRK